MLSRTLSERALINQNQFYGFKAISLSTSQPSTLLHARNPQAKVSISGNRMDERTPEEQLCA